MIINASVRIGNSADKKVCDDSLLFATLSPVGISNLLSWNSRLACEIPGDVCHSRLAYENTGDSWNSRLTCETPGDVWDSRLTC